MEDNIEETTAELVEESQRPMICEHTSGVNFCSGIRESGEQCSHCANCGEQL